MPYIYLDACYTNQRYLNHHPRTRYLHSIGLLTSGELVHSIPPYPTRAFSYLAIQSFVSFVLFFCFVRGFYKH